MCRVTLRIFIFRAWCYERYILDKYLNEEYLRYSWCTFIVSSNNIYERVFRNFFIRRKTKKKTTKKESKKSSVTLFIFTIVFIIADARSKGIRRVQWRVPWRVRFTYRYISPIDRSRSFLRLALNKMNEWPRRRYIRNEAEIVLPVSLVLRPVAWRRASLHVRRR